MEVTTVSPSPASPTEGDDLCETDVTNVAIHSVALLICICGLAGNGAVLWLLSLESRNSGIFYLALADFLFLLFTVPSALLFLVEDLSCTPIIPLTYVSFVFQLSVVSFCRGLYRLYEDVVNISDLCKLCCGWQIPLRLWWMVGGVQYWAFFSLFTVIPMLTFMCSSHKQGQCRAALISTYIIVLVLFVALMIISRTIYIIKDRRGFKKQQSKRQDHIISLIMLLTLLLSLWNFLQQLGYIPVSFEVFFLITCIHSSIKPLIYFVAGRCWSPCSMESLRLSLQRVFVEKEENPAGSDDDNTDTVI